MSGGLEDLALYVPIGLALSVDAATVSAAYGARLRTTRGSIAPAVAFGLAQGLMPAAGWLLGRPLTEFISSYGPLISLLILTALGIKFIVDSFGDVDGEGEVKITPVAIFMAAVATSIDACAVGFGLSVLQRPIIFPAVVFTVVTFVCSIVSYHAFAALSNRIGSKMLAVAGVVLILIGLKIFFFG